MILKANAPQGMSNVKGNIEQRVKQRAREVSAVHHAAEVAHAVAVVGRHMTPIAAELFPVSHKIIADMR